MPSRHVAPPQAPDFLTELPSFPDNFPFSPNSVHQRTSISYRKAATMSLSNLKEELRALISEISEIDVIPDNTSFKDLGIDSMMGVEIVAAIERQYKIKVADSELMKVTTLDSSFELVTEKLAHQSSGAAAQTA
jgi:acyl carrier protein